MGCARRAVLAPVWALRSGSLLRPRSNQSRTQGRWHGLVDLHSHILPGVDDGADDIDESVEIARAAERDGIAVLAATPHVRDDYPTNAATMRRLVDDVREHLRRAAVDIDVRPGGEIAFGMIARLGVSGLQEFCLAGNRRYVLVETPYRGWPLEMGRTFFDLQLGGMTAVLAHPERNPHVQEDPERLRPLVEGGTLVQLTASSLDGRTGKRVATTARHLLDLELAHLVASDAHRPAVRAGGVTAALEALDDVELALWLGRDMPGAIAGDDSVPARPSRSSRRGRRGRRR